MNTQYPRWWNTSLTVFNRVFDPDTKATTWQKTILQNCFYLQNSGLARSGVEIRANDNYVVRIPANEAYIPQAEWETMQSGQEGRFTLAPGDLIFKGEILDEIESGSGNSLLEQYKPDCFKIQSVYDGTGYGVLGHYMAEGV